MVNRSNKRNLFHRFGGDERGAVIVLFTIMVPVMLGIVGLVINGGRAFMVNNELQDIADAAAIAGARELDGTLDGMIAAGTAAKNLLQNDSRWSDNGLPAVKIEDPIFCSGLSGAAPYRTCVVTTNPENARFIQVTTLNGSVVPTFVRAVGSSNILETSAWAIAGTTTVACNVTPMMMCEPGGNINHFQPGVLFDLKSDTQLGPGAFALLDPPGLTSSGADVTRNLLASTRPNFCYVNDVSVATGQRTSSIRQGLNVRFDMYPSGDVGKSLLNYPPAPNVTKGKSFGTNGPNCSFSDLSGVEELLPFPLDSCFPTGCTSFNDGDTLIGDGNWDRTHYWNRNHADVPGRVKPAGWDNFSRYEAYLWELGIDHESEASQFTNMPWRELAQENPEPQCYQHRGGTEPIGTAERRILYVAVVDCSGISGNSTPPLQSARYGKFFLTRASEGGEVRPEFVDWITPDDDSGVLHRIVQLYR